MLDFIKEILKIIFAAPFFLPGVYLLLEVARQISNIKSFIHNPAWCWKRSPITITCAAISLGAVIAIFACSLIGATAFAPFFWFAFMASEIFINLRRYQRLDPTCENAPLIKFKATTDLIGTILMTAACGVMFVPGANLVAIALFSVIFLTCALFKEYRSYQFFKDSGTPLDLYKAKVRLFSVIAISILFPGLFIPGVNVVVALALVTLTIVTAVYSYFRINQLKAENNVELAPLAGGTDGDSEAQSDADSPASKKSFAKILGGGLSQAVNEQDLDQQDRDERHHITDRSVSLGEHHAVIYKPDSAGRVMLREGNVTGRADSPSLVAAKANG